MEVYNARDITVIGHAMVKYGGSFMAHIGRALLHADEQNAEKIINTWPKEIQRYYEFALLDNSFDF